MPAINVIDILCKHKGKENMISVKELMKETGLIESKVRSRIETSKNHFKKKGIVLAHGSNGKKTNDQQYFGGYYIMRDNKFNDIDKPYSNAYKWAVRNIRRFKFINGAIRWEAFSPMVRKAQLENEMMVSVASLPENKRRRKIYET